jgi:hypothetical protein
MTTCPYCGAQNSQNGAAYCTYCGSSLSGAKDSGTPPMQGQPASSSSSSSMPPSYPSGRGSYSFNTSERYERALKRTEQLGMVVAVLAVITLILAFI